MANTKGIDETINCPNGFYFGDPCYALKEELYDEWLNWADKKTGYDSSGKFVHKGKEIMLVDSTAYGDGCYDGCEMCYPVDSGCLAVIPLEYCTKKGFRDYGWVNRDDCGEIEFTTEKNGHFFVYKSKSRLVSITLEHVCTNNDDYEEEEGEDIDW